MWVKIFIHWKIFSLNYMTKIIAEIGYCHMGNLSLAKKVDISINNNGADLVKTQIFY